jgi:GTP-binding protein
MPKTCYRLVKAANVGHLFNRLAGERLAVVDDVPGTRASPGCQLVEWHRFHIIDTGGIDPSQVRPGEGKRPLSIGSADFIEQIRYQAEQAVQEADAVLFVTDADSGVTPADEEVAQILRRYQHTRDGQPWPPVLLVVNKADSPARRDQALQFYALGMGEPYPISAVHGTGTGDMLDVLVSYFQGEQAEDEEDNNIKIAIVGKPNAGKSSLLNRLLGEERAIVSPIPGTTRDAVDTNMEFDGTALTLIAAGIRRRGHIEPG